MSCAEDGIYAVKPGKLLHAADRLLAGTVLALLRFYQGALSPLKSLFFGPESGCRFHPTCSAYVGECFQIHSFFRACYLSARRLLRCHPFHPGGCDPVPPSGRQVLR